MSGGRWRRVAGAPAPATGLVVMFALFVLAFAGPRLRPWRYDEVDFTAFGAPPSAEHWFGTTQDGRDVYALTLRGMRRSLVIGLLAALGATGAAALVGIVAGLLGGRLDRLLMWVVDLLLALPTFLIILIAAPLLRGRSWLLLVVLIAAALWMITARIVRAVTLSLERREYVVAARLMGASPFAIMCRHIAPHLAALLIIDAALNVGAAVTAEAGLSYLGLGVQPPDSSLGTVLAEGAQSAAGYPWTFGFAAGLLVLTLLAAHLIGDGLCDALDPTSAGRVR
ncbi:MAG TPA: ABC transporter permease [Streptosporangiaceae bacterium]|nr:ABC transporter permease [Streptosporangiaceae bacterium]